MCFKSIYTVLKLNFVAVKMSMSQLFFVGVFGILETCTNNLIPILSVLVTWRGNDNSSFCIVDLS